MKLPYAAAFALLAFVTAASADDERRVPSSEAEVRLSYAPIVRMAAPAVVNVYATRVNRQADDPFFNDPFFRRFFNDFGQRSRIERSLGSGVIVDPSGIVVTNVHVIAGADEIRVALSDKQELPAEVVLKDERSDLAVLHLTGGEGPFPAVEIADSDTLEVGDLVLAIGNPFGVGQTVTSGIVSGLARTHVGVGESEFFIQTDAAINPGNSGGALIDMAGRLVGINTAIYSRSGGSDGIGFAIPSNMVRVVAASAEAGGIVRRPWIGASLQAVTPDIAAALSLSQARGALVERVDAGGPCDLAGLQPGDLILSFDGFEIDDPSALNYRLTTTGIGGEGTLVVLRDGQQYEAKLTLIAAPETVARDELTLAGRSPLTGATVANLSPAVAEEIGFGRTPSGVVITALAARSAAELVEFAPGDVIRAINGVAIDTTRTLEAVTAGQARTWEIEIDRNGQIMRTLLGG